MMGSKRASVTVRMVRTLGRHDAAGRYLGYIGEMPAKSEQGERKLRHRAAWPNTARPAGSLAWTIALVCSGRRRLCGLGLLVERHHVLEGVLGALHAVVTRRMRGEPNGR